MTGVLTPLGVLSVSAAIPSLAELEALAAAAQATAKLEITGKLTGLASVQLGLTFPPPPSVQAEAAAKLAVQLALNPSIAAPSLQIAANAKLIGELNAQLALLVMPTLPLGAFGVAAYKYEGTIDSLGPGVTGATSNGLPGGTGADVGYAVLLVATAPAAVAALQQLLVK
jgi:hypothetical protein